MTTTTRDKKDKKKKSNQSYTESEIFAMIEKALQTALTAVMDEIFKDFK